MHPRSMRNGHHIRRRRSRALFRALGRRAQRPALGRNAHGRSIDGAAFGGRVEALLGYLGA